MNITIQGYSGLYMGEHSNTGVLQEYTCKTRVSSSESMVIRVTRWRETICELP